MTIPPSVCLIRIFIHHRKLSFKAQVLDRYLMKPFVIIATLYHIYLHLSAPHLSQLPFLVLKLMESL